MIRSREEFASAGQFAAFLQRSHSLEEVWLLALLRHKKRPDLLRGYHFLKAGTRIRMFHPYTLRTGIGTAQMIP